MTTNEIMISCSVVTDNDEHAAKAAEVLGRAASGLVMDGVNVNLSLMRVEIDYEED